jgi:hypothetical protein
VNHGVTAQPADTAMLLRRLAEIAREQQDGIVRLERQSVATTTAALTELIPQLRSASGLGDNIRVLTEEALAVVTTSLSLLRTLAQARVQIVQSLRALGHTSGVALDTRA